MITESLIDFFLDFLTMLFQGLEIVSLPTQFISSVATIISYGVWVVGLDMMAIFYLTIAGWWTIKLTVGIVVWVWELLPLT